MPSFDSVNYSLRPSKSIERALAFEGLRRCQSVLDLSSQVYIGFGSIWFTDFQMAHKLLGVEDMISIESDDIGFARARFNAPYRTVRLEHDHSAPALARLYKDGSVNTRPWIVWLDYDYELDETIIEDVRSVIECAPTSSLLLVTFEASGKFAKPFERPHLLRSLVGALLPDDLPPEAFEETLPETLADLVLDLMGSAAVGAARPGGFLPAFRMIYADTATMVTVGGVLPAPGGVPAVREVVSDKAWPAIAAKRIVAPHLTIREAVTLQSQLPTARRLTRRAIQRLGFDLDQEQLEAFVRYYQYYPSYAQVNL